MANSNEHIEEFLNYYLEKETSPDYAVLITGCWGSGKTYFIKQYLAGKNPDGQKKDVAQIREWLTGCEKYTVVYASLFGAKSREDMDARVLETLKPVINSKDGNCTSEALSLIASLAGIAVGVAVAASVTLPSGGSAVPYAVPAGVATGNSIGNFLKNSWKEHLKKKEIKKQESLFKNDYLSSIRINGKESKRLVVVFDDVERADMPLPELLGYLNAYVEHLHVPCILLADKEKWEEAQKCQEDKSTLHKLSSTKEKVIGKEFKIQTTFDEVWDLWNIPENNPVGNRAWNYLNDCRDLIKEILFASQKNNYRALKHTLSDFQRFIGEKKLDSKQASMFIDDKYFEHMEFAELIIADFICYQYAFHIGDLKPTEITNYTEFAAEDLATDLINNQSKEQKQLNTYFKFEHTFRNIIRISTCAFDAVSFDSGYNTKWSEIWKEWLIESHVDTKHVKKIMDASIWFNEKDNFAINQLIKYHSLDNQTAEELLRDVFDGIGNRRYSNPNYVFVLFNSLLLLASEGVFAYDVKTLYKELEKYINDVTFDKVAFASMAGTISSNDKIVQEKQKELWNLINSKIPLEDQPEEQKRINHFWKTINTPSYDLVCKVIAESPDFPFTKIDLKTLANLYLQDSFRGIRGRLSASIICRFETLAQFKRDSQISQELDYLKGLDNVIDSILERESKPLLPSALALKSLKNITDTIEQRLVKYKGGENAAT